MILNYKIRKAIHEDMEKLWELDSKAFKGEAYPLFFIKQALELFPHTFYIAELDKNLIGFCIGSLVTGDTEKGWILSMAVEEKFRGKGIGTTLLNKIIDELMNLKCQEILLSVHPNNTSAKYIYKRRGFEKINEVESYFGEGNPRDIMRLKIRGN